MVQKLYIQDWENISETEHNPIQDMITYSLQPRQIAQSLLSGDSVDETNLDFEVTTDSTEAIPLHEILPSVANFLLRRTSAIDTITIAKKTCEQTCDDQFPNDPEKRKKCKENCHKSARTIAETIVNFSSFL